MKYNKNGLKLFIILSCVAALSLIADLYIHKHSYFGIDSHYFFYAWFSFLSSIIIVFISELLRFFLKRSKSYYQEESCEDR